MAIGLLVALVALWFGKLADRQLAQPDEGRYAEIPREMVATGDWITPRINGIKYLEKPPLQYWGTAVAYELFGVSEWSARLWMALTGLAAVAFTWFAGRRLLGADAGLYGALALFASPYFVILSGVNTLDMGVASFLSIAVLAYLLSRQATARASERNWMLVAWAAMALAVLSKGLIGIVLPLGALVAYTVWHRQLAAVRRLYWLPGLATFLAIVAPWFVLAARANPEFLEFFFIHEHLQRFTRPDHGKPGPVWYFIPILLLAAAPWLVAVFRGLLRAWRAAPQGDAVSPHRFLLFWCIVVVGFFSISKSKLPPYILPMIPALALLAGDAIAAALTRRTALPIAIGAIVCGALLLAAGLYVEMRPPRAIESIYPAFSRWIEAAAVLLVAAGIAGLYWTRRERPEAAIVVVLVAFNIAMSLGVIGYREIAPTRSAAAIAAEIERLGPRDAPVFSVGTYDHTLPFYLERLVTLVDFTGELAPGIRAEPEKEIESYDEFRRRWLDEPMAFAVIRSDVFEKLRDAGLPMTVLREERKRVLVRTPPR